MYCSHVDFSVTVSAAAPASSDTTSDSEIELQPLSPSSVAEGSGSSDKECTRNEEGREGGPSNYYLSRLLVLVAIVVSIAAAIAAATKLVFSSIKDGAPPRPTFVRFYSPGHCGTRFLTEIFMTKAVASTLPSSRHHHSQLPTSQVAAQHRATSLYWNEDSLYLGQYARAANLSLSQYQQHIGSNRFLPTIPMVDLDIDTTCLHRFDRKCHARVEPERVFKDDLRRVQLKGWNRYGNSTELEHYLVDNRIPKLSNIVQYFGPRDGLSQLVQFGHTHIFFDLTTYNMALSREFKVKWVRIRRRRTNVARSFAQDNGGKRPDPCLSEKGVVVCPWDETSILKPNRMVWDGWTVFQQHLWFVDEVEARWRMFLENQKGGRHLKVYVLRFQEDTDTISPADVDELASEFMNVDSPREVMKRMPHLSHISGDKMDETEMEAEALQYAQEAPWCQQNDLKSPVSFELDCSPNAY